MENRDLMPLTCEVLPRPAPWLLRIVRCADCHKKKPIERESRLFLYTVLLSCWINLVTAFSFEPPVLTAIVMLFLAILLLFRYGTAHEKMDRTILADFQNKDLVDIREQDAHSARSMIEKCPFCVFGFECCSL